MTLPLKREDKDIIYSIRVTIALHLLLVALKTVTRTYLKAERNEGWLMSVTMKLWSKGVDGRGWE